MEWTGGVEKRSFSGFYVQNPSVISDVFMVNYVSSKRPFSSSDLTKQSVVYDVTHLRRNPYAYPAYCRAHKAASMPRRATVLVALKSVAPLFKSAAMPLSWRLSRARAIRAVYAKKELSGFTRYYW